MPIKLIITSFIQTAFQPVYSLTFFRCSMHLYKERDTYSLEKFRLVLFFFTHQRKRPEQKFLTEVKKIGECTNQNIM